MAALPKVDSFGKICWLKLFSTKNRMMHIKLKAENKIITGILGRASLREWKWWLENEEPDSQKF